MVRDKRGRSIEPQECATVSAMRRHLAWISIIVFFNYSSKKFQQLLTCGDCSAHSCNAKPFQVFLPFVSTNGILSTSSQEMKKMLYEALRGSIGFWERLQPLIPTIYKLLCFYNRSYLAGLRDVHVFIASRILGPWSAVMVLQQSVKSKCRDRNCRCNLRIISVISLLLPAVYGTYNVIWHMML